MLQARVCNVHSSERGFTLVELVVYMWLSLVVVGAIFGVLVSQSRAHGLLRETIDARETLRGGASLLVAELRQASASRGDLYSIQPQMIQLRSVQGAAVVCAIHTTLPRYGLWDTSGTFAATADDSVLLYSVANATWSTMQVTQQWSDGASAGLSACAWGAAFVPVSAVEVSVAAASDTAGVRVGAPIRPFLRAQYGLFQQNGRSWLGRQMGSATSYELLTGPLRPPADSGLAFHYYDAAGAATTDPTQVVRVEVVLRAESFGKARAGGGQVGTRIDSVTVVAFLRN